MNLHAADLDRLRNVARSMSMAPATLAARFIEQGLAAADKEGSGRSTAALFRWLSPKLELLREQGGWPSTITIAIFDQIRDEALDLYREAAEGLGEAALNREIGRFVRENLRARAILRNGGPYVRKLSPSRGSLITGATLLEPDTESAGGEKPM